MKNKTSITVLTFIIIVISAFAAVSGIFSNDGAGSFRYQSIRGETIEIYGRGLYKHMSADVAVQGIAQDYVTLFAGIPFLLAGLFLFRKGSLRGAFLLTGTLLYFLLTYLFYTAMAMYNPLFLAYVILLGASLFGFVLMLTSFDFEKSRTAFASEKIIRVAGWFLMINSSMVAFLWLSTVLPPLLSGAVYPQGLQHYTTMIVQGFDLGLFLPLGFVSGLLAVKRSSYGFVFAPVYVIFLCFLMSALCSKISFMASSGVNVIPVVFIMPTICVIAIAIAVLLLKNMRYRA